MKIQTSRCRCWLTSIILAFGRPRQEAFQEIEVSLSYIVSSGLSYRMPQKRKSPQNNQPLHQTSLVNKTEPKKNACESRRAAEASAPACTSFTISHTWTGLRASNWILLSRWKIKAETLSIWFNSSGNKSGTWEVVHCGQGSEGELGSVVCGWSQNAEATKAL